MSAHTGQPRALRLTAADVHTDDNGQSHPRTSASLPYGGRTTPTIPQFPKSSVPFNNSHGKSGKVFTVLSKYRRATGLLGNYDTCWEFLTHGPTGCHGSRNTLIS